MKSFNFNRIIIVHSMKLMENPILKSVAPNLIKSIEKEISTLQKNNKLPIDVCCQSIDIQGEDDWTDFWNTLELDAKNGVKPIIHFVCHGSKDGLAISIGGNYQLISWGEVYRALCRVNVQSHCNLFVTMCVCHGYDGMAQLFKDHERIPFCGIVACPKNVNAYVAEASFPKFYSSLLVNKDVYLAMQVLNQELEKVCDTYGLEKNHLIISFSDVLFTKSYQIIMKKRSNPLVLEQEAIKALKEGGYPISREYRDEYIKIHEKNKNEIFLEIARQKFLYDLYPEEWGRFDIPESI